MVERIAVRAADRAARLMRSAVLLASLAAILFVSYGQVAPLPRGWSHWRLPIAIATAGVLALLIAWPSRRADARTRTADDVAAMLGAASMIVGIGAAMLIAIGLTMNVQDNRLTNQSLVYQLTGPSGRGGPAIRGRLTNQSLIYQLTGPGFVIACLLMAAPAAISGGLGLAIARRRGRVAGRVSTTGIALRFSAIGLGCVGLIVAFAAAALIYRWVTWG
jgi:hypothetical protein